MSHELPTQIIPALNLFFSLFVFISCKYVQTNDQEISKHPCTRICQANSTARTCYYEFEIEKYFARSKACFNCPMVMEDCFRPECIPADGVERMLTVINRQMPGPSVQVCLGDMIVVDVKNGMVEEATSIHWHGHHQERTPYMDGVPFITQCPIEPGTLFRYKFRAELAGTHFYHSHTGTQRSDGLYGPFVIRQPKINDIHGNLYDYDLPEHVIITTDWIHESGSMKYLSHYHSNGTNKPDSILINGFGKYRKFGDEYGNITYTPLAKFNITQGKRYRFRIVNAGVLYCPIEISVDNHTLIVINSDGGDVKPVYAQSLVTYAGERWDVVISANRNVSNYWIKFKGLKDCDENFNKVYSTAVLHYQGALNELPESAVVYEKIKRPGMQVNPVNIGSKKNNFRTVAELESKKVWTDPALKQIPDIFLTLAFDFYPIDNSLFHKKNLYGFHQVDKQYRRYIPQINHISMKMPSFPVLSQPEYIKPDTLCYENELQNCKTNFCHCTYTIDLPLHSTVEIIFVDEGVPFESNHPFHLHGHSFRVVALERLNKSTTLDAVLTLNKNNQIHRNLKNPPLKDTITVPAGGFTIIRFYTKNPGYWLLHCHLDFHVETGMAVLLKVGNTSDLIRPPENFPRCGNYFNSETTTSNDLNHSKHNASDESSSTDNSTNFTNAFINFWKSIKSTFSTSDSSSNYDKNSVLFALVILFVSKFV